MPASWRLAGRVQPDGFPPMQHFALVRPVQPHEDVAERGLAGAVLAEQRVHLAAPASNDTRSLATTPPGKRLVTSTAATAGPPGGSGGCGRGARTDVADVHRHSFESSA